MRTPSLSLLIKLGSIIVHADELTQNEGRDAHEFDVTVIRQLLADPDVTEWITEQTKAGFLPVKRSAA